MLRRGPCAQSCGVRRVVSSFRRARFVVARTSAANERSVGFDVERERRKNVVGRLPLPRTTKTRRPEEPSALTRRRDAPTKDVRFLSPSLPIINFCPTSGQLCDAGRRRDRANYYYASYDETEAKSAEKHGLLSSSQTGS